MSAAVWALDENVFGAAAGLLLVCWQVPPMFTLKEYLGAESLKPRASNYCTPRLACSLPSWKLFPNISETTQKISFLSNKARAGHNKHRADNTKRA